MENMDKGLTVLKWVLINWPKNLSAQIVCPSSKIWDFNEKRLHWASVVRGLDLVWPIWVWPISVGDLYGPTPK